MSWQLKELHEVLTLKRGYDLPNAMRRPGSVPIFSSSGESGSHDNAMVKGPGVITGRYGTIGEVFYTPQDFWPLNTTLYVCDFKDTDERFAYYLLKTIPWKAFQTASAVPGINRNHVAHCPVTIPDKHTQHRIVALLKTIDSLIENLAATNDYLESLIEAMLARALGEENATEVSLGDYLYIKGRIGWKGLKKSEYLPVSDYRIINGESLTLSGINWEKAGFISKERYDESPEIMLEIGDILLSKDGTIGKIGYVDELEKPTSVASGIFVIRNTRQEELSTHFIYYLLKSHMFKAFVAGRTEGSVIPHLYQKDFVEFVFPLPDATTMKRFDDVTRPMFEQVIANTRENKMLAELRDALLPRLMSGEIDVSKIELPTQPNNHLSAGLLTPAYRAVRE